MWRLSFILAWLGLTSGLQPGLEYQYRYNGRLATGMTDMRHHFAAVGIRADLTLQVADNYSFMMKLDNIEAGDFHGNHNCDLRLPIPIAYEALENGKDFLERPFRVSLENDKDAAFIQVASDEPSWITNLRKSIVNILPFAAIWEKIRESKRSFITPSFGKEEQLIGGQCMNWYVVTKMPDYKAAKVRQERESKMEEDIQREGGPSSASYKAAIGRPSGEAKDHGGKESKTLQQSTSRLTAKISTIHDDLWTVTRTVDYQMCSHLVEMKVNDDGRRDDVISRVSKARYVIRGGTQGIRMEKALVEGSTSVFTGSGSNENIDTFTNQSLELRAVRITTNEFVVDYETRDVFSKQYDVESSSSSKGLHSSLELEEKLTGVQRRCNDSHRLKEILFDSLAEMNQDAGGDLIVAMEKVVKTISCFSYEQIEAMLKLLQGKVQFAIPTGEREKVRSSQQNFNNFKMALVLSGTETAVKILLDVLENATTRLEDETIFYFFKQIHTTLKAPNLVPRILALATLMSWEGGEDIAKTLALTASASLADKFCLNGERRNTFKDTTSNGESVCETDEVVSKFIPYLKEGIQNTSSPSWQRVIHIQALVNLGTPLALDILHPIIIGTHNEDVSLRTTAISSLAQHLLPQSALGQVYNILVPVMENEGEHPDVRSMAFLIMTSWHPGPSWWKHMALFTWHEPSVQLTQLISSTIRMFAERDDDVGKMVSRVLYLTKPVAAISFSHSSAINLRNYLNSEHLDKGFSIVWFANMERLLPTHIFINYEIRRPRAFFFSSKISMYQNKMEFFLQLLQQYIDQYKYGDERTDGRDLVFELIHAVQEKLQIKYRGFPLEAELLLKFDDNYFYGKNVEFFKGGKIFGFIKEFQRYLPETIENMYYDKSIDTTIAYPTDLGLPFIVQYSAQSALKITPSLGGITSPSDFPKTRFKKSVSFTIQIRKEASVKTETIVPWLRSSVGSGIQNTFGAYFPATVHFLGHYNTKQAFVRLQLSADEVQLVKASNHPYTVVYKGIIPFQSVEGNDFKLISKYDESQFSTMDRLAAWSGIWLESSCTGDIEFPGWSSTARGLFTFPTLDYAKWDYLMTYEAVASDTKNISLIFTYASAEKRPFEEVDPELDASEQKSPGAPLFKDDPQYSQSASQEVIDDPVRTVVEGDIRDSLERTKQFHEQIESGQLTSIGVSLAMHGSVKHNYDVMMTLIRDHTYDHLNSELKVRIYRDVPMGLAATTYMTCLDFGFHRPNILPLATTEEILGRDFASGVVSEVRNGLSCDTPAILKMKGRFRVTEEQWEAVREELTNGCSYNINFPVKDIITSQLFNQAKLEITWTKNLPESWLKHIHHLYDMLRGCFVPAGMFDYSMRHRDYSININAYKNLVTNRWRVRTTQPREASIHEISLPPLFGFPASTLDTFIHHFINGRNPSICVVTSEKVYTFDGENFPFAPNNCWKMAAFEYDTMQFVLQVRYTEKWEAKFLWKDRGLMFEVTNSQILVNGKSGTGTDARYEVFNMDNATLLTLNNGIAIKVSDKVEIQMTSQVRSNIFGLCGFYNGDKTFEMLGPKGCVYLDPVTFADAWESPGEGCNVSSHQSRKLKVTEYQTNCLKKTYIPTGISHENVQDPCIRWEYQEKIEGTCECKALLPTPTCNSGCVSSSNTTEEQIAFDCHPTEGHSDTDANCHLKTYATSFPIDCKHL